MDLSCFKTNFHTSPHRQIFYAPPQKPERGSTEISPAALEGPKDFHELKAEYAQNANKRSDLYSKSDELIQKVRSELEERAKLARTPSEKERDRKTAVLVEKLSRLIAQAMENERALEQSDGLPQEVGETAALAHETYQIVREAYQKLTGLLDAPKSEGAEIEQGQTATLQESHVEEAAAGFSAKVTPSVPSISEHSPGDLAFNQFKKKFPNLGTPQGRERVYAYVEEAVKDAANPLYREDVKAAGVEVKRRLEATIKSETAPGQTPQKLAIAADKLLESVHALLYGKFEKLGVTSMPSVAPAPAVSVKAAPAVTAAPRIVDLGQDEFGIDAASVAAPATQPAARFVDLGQFDDEVGSQPAVATKPAAAPAAAPVVAPATKPSTVPVQTQALPAAPAPTPPTTIPAATPSQTVTEAADKPGTLRVLMMSENFDTFKVQFGNLNTKENRLWLYLSAEKTAEMFSKNPDAAIQAAAKNLLQDVKEAKLNETRSATEQTDPPASLARILLRNFHNLLVGKAEKPKAPDKSDGTDAVLGESSAVRVASGAPAVMPPTGLILGAAPQKVSMAGDAARRLAAISGSESVGQATAGSAVEVGGASGGPAKETGPKIPENIITNFKTGIALIDSKPSQEVIFKTDKGEWKGKLRIDGDIGKVYIFTDPEKTIWRVKVRDSGLDPALDPTAPAPPYVHAEVDKYFSSGRGVTKFKGGQTITFTDKYGNGWVATEREGMARMIVRKK